MQYRGKDGSGYALDGSILTEGEYPLRFANGDRLVLRMDTLEEEVILTFEAVFIGALKPKVALVASASPSQRGCERRKEKEGEVGLLAVADKCIHT